MHPDITPTQKDFEELQEDVSHSPLWNKDLAPTTIKERTWSTWNIAALWIGMSVVITTYELVAGDDHDFAGQHNSSCPDDS
jgi:cytosine/uracil/thiamine/allantoin permease